MSRRQAYIIIALLGVIAVALAALVVVLVRSDDPGAESAPPTDTPTPATPTEVRDPVEVLESAGVDVVEPPPVPEAPEAWGDYELGREWDGQVRVFRDSEAEPVAGADGGRFPASMNNCGSLMYFVTFRAAGEGVVVDAQLVDAAGDVNDSKPLAGGWMLGTNCSTPHFVFHSAESETDLADVAYTVYEYRQTSLAEPITPSEPPAPVPEPPAPAQPTLVECIPGLSVLGIFSDGTRREDERCFDAQAAEAEGVCGGMYGWERVSRERYIELCGVEPPTGG